MIRDFRDKRPQIHPTAYIAENACVIGDVVIGEESSVWFGAIVRGDVNFIRIGARVGRRRAGDSGKVLAKLH